MFYLKEIHTNARLFKIKQINVIIKHAQNFEVTNFNTSLYKKHTYNILKFYNKDLNYIKNEENAKALIFFFFFLTKKVAVLKDEL